MVKKSAVKASQSPQKPKHKTDLAENTGKVLINLGQIVFATLFLGGVLRGEVPRYLMVLSGVAGAFIFILLGLLLSAKEQKDKE